MAESIPTFTLILGASNSARSVSMPAQLLRAAHHTSFGCYSDIFADAYGHPTEVVPAPALP